MSSLEIRVITPGALTTIQDEGRYGYQSLGFPVGGAADIDSMHRANLLCGNDPGEAVLEMTVSGATVQFMCDTVIALSGADMAPIVNGIPVETEHAIPVYAGSYLSLSYAAGGIRTYLACAGGFDIAPVMGSNSTSLKLGFGGFKGRKLAPGDVLLLKRETTILPNMETRFFIPMDYMDPVYLRCITGPQDDMFTQMSINDFYSSSYIVSPASDRMGIRLEGDPLISKDGTDIISDGIVAGSIQVPRDGRPILLISDHQTTGGYAKIATVISADLPKAGQLSPGQSVRFAEVTLEEARMIAIEKRHQLEELKKLFVVTGEYYDNK